MVRASGGGGGSIGEVVDRELRLDYKRTRRVRLFFCVFLLYLSLSLSLYSYVEPNATNASLDTKGDSRRGWRKHNDDDDDGGDVDDDDGVDGDGDAESSSRKFLSRVELGSARDRLQALAMTGVMVKARRWHLRQ